MRAWSGPTGSATSVPSASGTRTASPWPPSSSVPPHQPPCRQDVCSPCAQNSQVPSDQANGATTRSPFFTVRTAAPTSSTTPMNSWPIRLPTSLAAIELYGQRSLPQIHARVTRTRASVDSTSRASGTVSTRTSCVPYISVARISSFDQNFLHDRYLWSDRKRRRAARFAHRSPNPHVRIVVDAEDVGKIQARRWARLRVGCRNQRGRLDRGSDRILGEARGPFLPQVLEVDIPE